MSREEFEAVDRIAQAAGLVPPTRWWRGRTEGPGSGRTTRMALHVAAALEDGWTCWVAADSYTLAIAFRRLVEEIAEKAGVVFDSDFLQRETRRSALRMQVAGAFNPEHKSALFLDHPAPGTEYDAGPSGGDAWTKTMRADMERHAANPPTSPFHATRRTSVNTVPVRTGPGPEDVEFHEETIYETLADETRGRWVQARWVRTSEPTTPTQR